MKELIEFIAKKLVSSPEDVVVESNEDEEGNIRILLKVAQQDIGKVIGRQGRVAKAMRVIMRTATHNDKHYILDIDSGKDEQ